MPAGQLRQVLHHLRRATVCPTEDAPDPELLERFLRSRDDRAFEALVHRHGPLVLGVCRRILRNEADAEDAFQATFLVLARKAATLRQRNLLGSWLHGIAHNTALKARAMIHKRRMKERVRAAQVIAPSEPEQDLQDVLDDELGRLPEKFRVPVVLCELEGKTIKEAAQLLGVPQGTAASRLARGRTLLAARLRRQGVMLSGGALAMLLARQELAARVSSSLVAATMNAVGGTATPGTVVALADGVVKGLLLKKLQALAVTMLLLALVLAGAASGSALLAANAEPPRAGDAAGAGSVKEKEVRMDVQGDALPPGALARLGTVRWRHGDGLSQLGFTAGGKQLVTAGGDGLVRVWDVETGKELRRFGHAMTPDERPGCKEEFRAGMPMRSVSGDEAKTGAVLTPDGSTAALAESDRSVSIWDVATGKERCRITGTRDQGGAVSLGFTPDGKKLVSQGRDRSLILWDAVRGTQLQRLSIAVPRPNGGVLWAIGDIAYVLPCVVSPDGRHVAVFDIEANPAPIHVWDLASGKEAWHIDGDPGGYPVWPVFTSDGKKLIRIAGDHSVRVYDAENGKELQRLYKSIKDYSPSRIALAPDDRSLAVLTIDDLVVICDLKNIRQNVRLGEKRNISWGLATCTALAYSPDGKTLVQGTSFNTLRLWDVASGKGHDLLGAGHAGCVGVVCVSRDGREISTMGSDGTIRLWDATTGRERKRVPLPRGSGIALSADGHTLLTTTDGTTRVVKVLDETESRRLLPPENSTDGPRNGFMLSGRFSRNGRRVAAATFGFQGPLDRWAIDVWDTTTGRSLRRLTGTVHLGNFPPETDRYLADHALAPDGNSLLTLVNEEGQTDDGKPATVKSIMLQNVDTGRVVWRVEAEATFRACAFAADGRQVAVALTDRVLVLEATTGKQRVQVPGSARLLAFAPTGQCLAVAEENTVRLWDLAHGTELGRLSGHQGRIQALAFTSDGKALVTGSVDSTALVWDLAPLAPRARVTALPSEKIENVWNDLAGDDGAKAFQAMVALREAPKETLALLQKRLEPVGPANAARVRKLIADLDSEAFEVRQEAEKELAAVADQAGDQLREALEKTRSPEMTRRLRTLLEPHEPGGTLPRGTLRQVRAVEVLQQLNTPAARQLLEALAHGAPGARLTREAKAALLALQP